MVEFALQAFLTLFVLIDPIGLIPLFLALVGTRSYEEQKRIALRSTLVAGVLVLAFALLGGIILHYLDISLEALKVAGGLLLFKIALDMINAQLERETDEEHAESQARADISVFPLAIPLIAGPGTLAGVLILAGTAPSGIGGFVLVLGMAAMVLFLTYWSLRAALKFSSSLGRTGINVITRVLGILLAALAVQYIADGVRVLLELS
ncbi:MarC family protein [uncultured Meiothermus sp.]|jgi:multiple antibiotic resistance protein|uniref:MarC family protein n=1 Tax=uncultured Meiothermus sp. TaxID=157471 RepID=UPI002624A7DC|nr:MarC family protein [uncultured Meiothermus sp.]